MPTIFIPSMLRPLCDGHGEVRVPGSTVGEALRALIAAYPALEERIFHEGSITSGRVQMGMSVAVDGEVSAHPFSHGLREDSELSIIPAIAGGDR